MSSVWLAIVSLSILGLVFGIILGYSSYHFAVKNDPIVDQVDALLPQSQCGQCGYPGCRSYAEAVSGVHNYDKNNYCIPGGEEVMIKIAALLNVDPQSVYSDKKVKKIACMSAFINELDCIGCTKCIQVCPVDAIVGTMRAIHTVIADLCTGCKLCVALCPTQCIELRQILTTPDIWQWSKESIPIHVIPVR